MREELAIELINMFNESHGDINDIKMRITMILDNYEIEKRKSELIVYEEDANVRMIKKFIASKLAAGRTTRTCKYYKDTLIKSLEAIGKTYDQITADDIRFYIAKRVQIDKVSKTTANNERRNLSSFYTWLQTEEILMKNPMAKVESIKEKKQKKKAFSEYEVELIRNACRTEREKAMVELLLSTWCRVSEVAQIKIEDLSEQGIIVHGKGEKDREVFLNARARLAIECYLNKRKDNNPYLFPRCKHSGVQGMPGVARKELSKWYEHAECIDETRETDKGTIESIIRNIGKRAGVKQTHPHRFRRTGATQALRNGMELTLVSKLLGHESIATTQIYLDISTEELMEAHRKYV